MIPIPNFANFQQRGLHKLQTEQNTRNINFSSLINKTVIYKIDSIIPRSLSHSSIQNLLFVNDKYHNTELLPNIHSSLNGGLETNVLKIEEKIVSYLFLRISCFFVVTL
jgi:hypothetical protein